MERLEKGGTYFQYANALSMENASAILVSTNIAEHPVKNWTRLAKHHIIVLLATPPASRKI